MEAEGLDVRLMYSILLIHPRLLVMFFLIVNVFLVCRIMSLAQDYCLRRSVFGKLLVNHTLHMQTLARMEVSGFFTL